MLSCSLMTACYHNYDKPEWVNILTVKMKGKKLQLFKEEYDRQHVHCKYKTS